MIPGIAKYSLLLIVALIGGLIVLQSSQYFSPDFSTGYLAGKQSLFPGPFSYGLYMHMTAAPLALLCGIIQFSVPRTRWPKLHRFTGYSYIILVTALAAPGALLMASHAIGGQTSQWCFTLLAILWIAFTLIALQRARAGDFPSHHRYMQRSFILCCSAVALRILQPLFIHGLDWPVIPAYQAAAWCSWLLPLLGYESYSALRHYRRHRAK